jgi:hypothetical protein
MPGMSTKSREVIWGGQVRAAEMNVLIPVQAAHQNGMMPPAVTE